MHKLEKIRWAMLRSIEKIELTAARRITLERRILLAQSAVDLWFLRTDVWQAIGRGLGEREANLTLNKVSDLFTDALPAAWTR